MSKTKNIEIERKFLVRLTPEAGSVREQFEHLAHTHAVIKQGYILAAKEKTVRVRIKDTKGYLTIKGAANANGFSRFEWETELSCEDAEQLLELCEGDIIHKTRYEVPYGGRTFEVDLFHGVHAGLVLAELELETEDDTFDSPEWLGREVTGDVRYYNAWLSHNPTLPPME